MNEMIVKLKEEYDRLFGDVDTARVFFSPGKITIMGDTLSYNGGDILSLAINRGTYFIIKKNNLNKVRAYSTEFASNGLCEFDILDLTINKEWYDFIKVVMKHFNINFGFDMVCGANIPIKSGLSSTTSLITGIAYALTSLNQKKVAGTPLAINCYKVESKFLNNYVNIVDAFTICNGHKDSIYMLNSHTLQYEKVLWEIKDYILIIADTKKKIKLTDKRIIDRQKECKMLLSEINKLGYNYSFLCDISLNDYKKICQQIDNVTLNKRLKHIINENERVIKVFEAFKNEDYVLIGNLLNMSHQSLKANFEISCDELDTFVETFNKQEGCLGAKMSADGCVIALVKKSLKNKVLKNVFKDYVFKFGYEPNFYEVKISNGTREIKNNNQDSN